VTVRRPSSSSGSLRATTPQGKWPRPPIPAPAPSSPPSMSSP